MKYVNAPTDTAASARPGQPAPPGADSARASADEDEDGRIGIFPSWRALYISVVVYTAGLIAILRVFTVLLDSSAR